jgi:hypothetical protein
MNLWTKQQSNMSMYTAIHRSLYLALLQISHKFVKDLIQHPVGNFKDSAKSKTRLNQKIVLWLIVDCVQMLDKLDHKEIPTHFLWQHAKAARARFEQEAKEGQTTNWKTTNWKKRQAEFTETEWKEAEEQYTEDTNEPEADTNSGDELDDNKVDAHMWPFNKLASKDITVEGIKRLKGLKKKWSTCSLKMEQLYHHMCEGEALQKKVERESKEELDQNNSKTLGHPTNTLTPSRPQTVLDAMKIFLPEGVDLHSMQVQATKKLTGSMTCLHWLHLLRVASH